MYINISKHTLYVVADMDNFIEIVTDAYDRQNLVPKAFLAQVPLVVHKYLVRTEYSFRIEDFTSPVFLLKMFDKF